jgi:hypothetical protein
MPVYFRPIRASDAYLECREPDRWLRVIGHTASPAATIACSSVIRVRDVEHLAGYGVRAALQGSALMPAGKGSSEQPVRQTAGPALKRYLGATVRAADRIDYWIRRHAIEMPLDPGAPIANETRSSRAPLAPPARASARHTVRQSRPDRLAPSKLMLACDRRAWLAALGQSLKSQYEALAAPLPPRLAVLVKQLEAQDQTR